MPSQPGPWKIYRQALTPLKYGDALWEPGPIYSYRRVRLGDVGYTRQGRFHLLFSAGIPLGSRVRGNDVPLTFEPLDVGPIIQGEVRSPGYLRTNTVQEVGVDVGGSVAVACSVEPGARMSFALTHKQGAALITQHPTYREDIERRGIFEKYIKQSYNSWVDFAREQGHGDDVRPILVTGVHLTREFATIAYSNSQTRMECEFSVGVPAVASGSVSVWGSWHTPGLVHTNCGPDPSRIRGNSSSSESPTLESAVPEEYDQCVFIRYFTIRRRVFIPTILKAGGGPHQLQEGSPESDDASEEILLVSSEDGSLEVDYPEAESPTDASDKVIHNVPMDDRDEFDVIAEFIFQRSDANSVLLHHRDIQDLLQGDEEDPARLLDESGLVQRIEIDGNGVAQLVDTPAVEPSKVPDLQLDADRSGDQNEGEHEDQGSVTERPSKLDPERPFDDGQPSGGAQNVVALEDEIEIEMLCSQIAALNELFEQAPSDEEGIRRREGLLIELKDVEEQLWSLAEKFPPLRYLDNAQGRAYASKFLERQQVAAGEHMLPAEPYQHQQLQPNPSSDVRLRFSHVVQPLQRPKWVMWVGNIPSDVTDEELWKFFNKPPNSSEEAAEQHAGVSFVFLIARANCAFVSFDTEDHLAAAITRSDGQKIRPDDPKCPNLVFLARERVGSLRAGVGGRQGAGLLTSRELIQPPLLRPPQKTRIHVALHRANDLQFDAGMTLQPRLASHGAPTGRLSPVFEWDTGTLAEAATDPPLPSIHLICDNLPWRIKVSPSLPNLFVTNYDVLQAIHVYLRTPVGAAEWFLCESAQRDTILQTFERRVGMLTDEFARTEERAGSVRRIDWLLGLTRLVRIIPSNDPGVFVMEWGWP